VGRLADLHAFIYDAERLALGSDAGIGEAAAESPHIATVALARSFRAAPPTG
jgi:hypothetical protein